ncbi:single-stranded DNA-binding protein [Muricauda sp. JGD-17]|uniref:Single-stranded DNA-binding protein n=1 Tax=Flagellimonas ochracea TaxID=2696472 RepID=A0A964TCB9_9FLAO|nr:single-stranded DNA-binding protein [Allomuricauda ochracea]NAY91413.1 single-stranded DNA-binding protein [Allomuricauda ochracea]
MGTIKNHVQLIGHLGEDPKVTTLESGRKVARFRMAINEHYRDANGEKQTDTNWHTVLAWGKVADIVEKYTAKGKEIGVTGKLRTRTYTTDDGNQRYVTEVQANEILLLGGKNGNATDA